MHNNFNLLDKRPGVPLKDPICCLASIEPLHPLASNFNRYAPWLPFIMILVEN